MGKLIFAFFMLIGLCCAVHAQFSASLPGVPGCSLMVPGGTFMDEGIPNGCGPMVPSIQASSGPPPVSCVSTGVFNLGNTCNDIYFIGALR